MYTVDTAGGGTHIVSLQFINTHKEEEGANTDFFQANVMDKAAAVGEYVLKFKYFKNKQKFSGSFFMCMSTAVSWLLGDGYALMQPIT